MKTSFHVLATGVLAVALAASAYSMEGHKTFPAQEIKWGPGPASLPPGSQAAVLHGDPSKDGLFALRLKLPKGYHVPPHTHPKPEVVTILSGKLRFGMGEAADHGKAQVLSAGSLFSSPPNMAHYVYADEDTEIQLNSNGPWGITYINPKDDPRQKK